METKANAYTIDGILKELISELRYLETLECRRKMVEADRVEKRSMITERFRGILKMQEFVSNRKSVETDYDLYK